MVWRKFVALQPHEQRERERGLLDLGTFMIKWSISHRDHGRLMDLVSFLSRLSGVAELKLFQVGSSMSSAIMCHLSKLDLLHFYQHRDEAIPNSPQPTKDRP